MKRTKLISTILTCAAIFGGTASVCGAAAGPGDMPYSDVTSGDWFYSAVEYAYENGLMNGVDTSRFAPQGEMSRAMLVTVLGRLDGAEQKETNTFPDLEKNSWYSGYVGWAAENGIVGGYPDGTFCPDKSVSREEVAAIISRYISYIKAVPMRNYSAPDKFTDGDSVDEWAAEYVDNMRRTGILMGNNDGSFNPVGTLTRAESATILQRLREIILNITIVDGIVPSYLVEGEDFYLLGAWDMYYSGGALTTNHNGSRVNDSGSLPYLTGDENGRSFRPKVTYAAPNMKGLAKPSNNAAGKMSFFALDIKALCIDPASYPFVRLGFRTTNGTAPSFGISTSTGGFVIPSVEVKPESGANGWSTAVIDLSSVRNWEDGEPEISLTVIGGDGADVELLYAAVFKSAREAAGFDLAKYSGVIKEFKGERASFGKIDSGTLDGFMDRIDGKIDEIGELPDIDPSEISGTCWYVSSIHGDDSNSGKSPDDAFKTVAALTYQRGPVTLNRASKGDAVFFERGSVFGRQSDDARNALDIDAVSGVTYAAYGSGEKPVFTMALDYNGSRNWVATEYKNIYKLGENLPVNEEKPAFYDVGSISINGGTLWGVDIYTDVPQDMYAEGAKTVDCGMVFNGEETYRVDSRDCTAPDVLKNNLEYFQNYDTGELYMYCEQGNPGEVYKDIVISLRGDGISADAVKDTVLHNLAVKYCGSHGISTGDAENLVVSGCELEWIGGSLQGYGSDSTRFGNAIQNWGGCSGIYVHDCYINQVYDTGFTSQGSFGSMTDITVTENVIENTIMFIEMFNSDGGQDKSHLMQNIVASDNCFRYAGFGFGNQRPQGDKRCGFFIGQMSLPSPENINHVFENNLCVYSSFHVMQDTDIARGDHAQGIIFRNNTYVLGDTEYYMASWKNLTDKTGGSKNFYPYTEQYLTYFTNLGIDRGSVFYYYEGERTEAEAAGAYRYPEV